MRNVVAVAALVGLGVGAPAAAQMQPVKPIRVKPLPAGSIAVTAKPIATTLRGSAVRPSARPAAAWRAALSSATARFKRPGASGVTVASAMKPGITRLNGARSGTIEPGGDYEIAGRGFGTARGAVFVRTGGRTLEMRVTHWADTVIYASMPGDVAGLLDGAAELAVGPAGKAPYKTGAFAFRAARADVTLPIGDAMFRHEGSGSVTVAGQSIPISAPPQRRSFDGTWYQVNRTVQDGDEKKCIAPGRDRISWDGVRLNPGFEVSAYYFERMDFRDGENARRRGAWAFAWEGNSIRVDFGVMRYYTPRYGLIGGDGGCSSYYKIRLVATGPRGISPLQ